MTGQIHQDSIHILVAEDEAILRRLFTDILESAGFQVLAAEDGKEALRVAHEHPGPIQLLISNFRMPCVSGLEVARRIRAQIPDVRVLLISGYPANMLVLDRGWEFLQKPFLPRMLLEKVRAMLALPLETDTVR